jgi:hypothetical protein
MQIIIGGTLRPDGTLQLDDRPPIVPGRVRVTIEGVGPAEPQADALAVFEEIIAEQDQSSDHRRSAAELDAGIDALRDEWDERQQELEQIQRECQQAR